MGVFSADTATIRQEHIPHTTSHHDTHHTTQHHPITLHGALTSCCCLTSSRSGDERRHHHLLTHTTGNVMWYDTCTVTVDVACGYSMCGYSVGWLFSEG